jgi:hypothetical protein
MPGNREQECRLDPRAEKTAAGRAHPAQYQHL